jgi:histidinol-phosphate aminotransferase
MNIVETKPRFTDFKTLLRKGILNTKPYSPGKPVSAVKRELGLTDIVKLASNENPEGPMPEVVKAVQKAAINLNRYPDASCHELTVALSNKLNVSPDSIILGNGSNEIIDMFIRALVSPGENVVYPYPSFIVYPLTTAVHFECGKKVMLDSNDKHDLVAMAEAVDENTKMVIVCNPNNPTGTYNSANQFQTFMEAIPEKVIVLVDEAYFEYVTADDYPDVASMLISFPNIVIARTFSKIYSLAGLRVGYAFGHPDLIRELHKTREPFNVNSLAQVAAITCLDLDQEVSDRALRNKEWIADLEQDLTNLGLEVTPSQTNFLLVRCSRNATELQQELLKMGVIVRPMSAFGLGDGAIRISVGLPEENKKCIDALKQILQQPASQD